MLRWRYLKTCFRFWFGSIWAAVGTAFLLTIGWIACDRADFERRATVTDARIVEKGKDSNGDGSSRCWLRYVWHDESGREQVGLATTGWQQWRTFGDADTVRVRYLPDDPTRNALLLDSGDAARRAAPLLLAAAVLIAGIGWTLVLSAWRVCGRRVALVRTGTVAQGTVLGLRAIRNLRINQRNPVYLRVAYKDELGSAREVDSACLPAALLDRWQAGDAIRVVYDAFDPARCEVDLFDVRA